MKRRWLTRAGGWWLVLLLFYGGMAYLGIAVIGAPVALAVFVFAVLTLAAAIGSWLGLRRLHQ